ncbi:MAG: hypothetical protein IJN22_05935 [Clostridia bacterium]|nr:hypothetical protein [Clostridia bacterium]
MKIHILVNQKAHLKIKRYIQAVNNKCETGGLLLGYRFLNYFLITEITATNDAESSSVSFVLNGEKHIEQAEKIIKKYLLKPILLGIWHSHTHNVIAFSIQDQKSNSILISQIGSIISTIVTFSDITKDCNYTSCYIKPKGKEHFCLTKVIKGILK